MRSSIFKVTLSGLLGLILSACGDERDTPLSGAELTRIHCSNCHSLDSVRRRSGPTLQGIFGRTPTITGVPFSVWDEKSLDAWIERPLKIKRGTRMAIPGIRSAAQRQAIISYLKTL